MEAVLAATAQHHERLSEQISLDQEKIKIQNLKNSFLLNMDFAPSQSPKDHVEPS